MGNIKTLVASFFLLLILNVHGAELEPMRFFTNWEVGQIEEAFHKEQNGRVDRDLINHATVWTLQEAKLSDNARVFLGVGGAYFFVFPRNLGINPYVNSKRSGFGLTDAHGEFEFFSREDGDHGLLLKAGIFGYKYNEDAKNLGEYMFRTWTYPNIIYTGGLELINSAAVQLSGLNVNTKLGSLNNDLILSIQSDHAPIFGLSLTDIVSYKIGGILTLGAGFMLDNFYHPDDESVKPTKVLENRYYDLADGSQMSAKEFYDNYYLTQQYYVDDFINNAIIPNPDSVNVGAFPANVTKVDSNYYSFSGEKVMVRASLDLGKVVPLPMKSEKDLRVYFEAIVMGLKDYPTFYTDINERIAYMYGINLPTFGLLDVLAFEVENTSNPFENSTKGPYGQGTALPPIDGNFPNIRPITRDDFKWTVFVEKKVYDSFSIYAQAANDHMRVLDVFSVPDFGGFLPNGNNWYWVFKLAYAI